MAKEEIKGAGTAPKEETKKPETVEIPVDKLDTLIKKVEGLEADRKTDKAIIDALEKTVSSTKLQEAKDEQGKDMRPRVHFKVLDGKAVIGWPEKLGPDKVAEIMFNPNTNMPMGEILKSVYYFVDGTKSELIDQIRMARSNEFVYARVIEDKGETAVLEFEDKSVASEPIEIHKKFWNHQ